MLQSDAKIQHPTEDCTIGICKESGVFQFVPDPDCDIECEDGKEYDICGCHHTCTDLEYTCDPAECQPGCYCPADMVWDGAQCITKENCGCVVNGTIIDDGEDLYIDECNKCTCEDGKLDCYEVTTLYTHTIYYSKLSYNMSSLIVVCFIPNTSHYPR